MPFEEALEEVVRNQDPKHLQEGQQLHVGFTGSFGFHRVSPRELLSGFLGTLVQVEGIVTKCACEGHATSAWAALLRGGLKGQAQHRTAGCTHADARVSVPPQAPWCGPRW